MRYVPHMWKMNIVDLKRKLSEINLSGSCDHGSKWKSFAECLWENFSIIVWQISVLVLQAWMLSQIFLGVVSIIILTLSELLKLIPRFLPFEIIKKQRSHENVWKKPNNYKENYKHTPSMHIDQFALFFCSFKSLIIFRIYNGKFRPRKKIKRRCYFEIQ